MKKPLHPLLGTLVLVLACAAGAVAATLLLAALVVLSGTPSDDLGRWFAGHPIAATVASWFGMLPAARGVAGWLGKLGPDATGLGSPRPLLEYGAGAALGGAMLTAPVGLAFGLGGYELGPSDGFAALPGVLFLLPGLAFAAFAEEFVFRGVLLPWWARSVGGRGAVAVTALLFSAIHLANPGASALAAVGVILAGIWLGVAWLTSRSLWYVSGLHLGWNAATSVLLGLPVSGIDGLPSLLRMQASGGAWAPWIGSGFGPEEGLLFHGSLVVGLAASIVVGGLLGSERSKAN